MKSFARNCCLLVLLSMFAFSFNEASTLDHLMKRDQYFCGTTLSNTLKMICRGRYNKRSGKWKLLLFIYWFLKSTLCRCGIHRRRFTGDARRGSLQLVSYSLRTSSRRRGVFQARNPFGEQGMLQQAMLINHPQAVLQNDLKTRFKRRPLTR